MIFSEFKLPKDSLNSLHEIVTMGEPYCYLGTYLIAHILNFNPVNIEEKRHNDEKKDNKIKKPNLTL